MSKRVFLFPGQGSQYVGMGKELAENYSCAREVYLEADEVLKTNLSKIIFEGNEEDLKKTQITQPAVLTTSIAILSVLKAGGITPDAAAGLSLGEYSALVCAGVMSFRDALHVVQNRARYMQETVPLGKGSMAAILGLDPDEVRDLCEKSLSFGHVEPANYNCPGQIVIAGHREAVEEVCRLAKEKKARAVILSVSVPFHCKLLSPVEEKMASLLSKIPLKEASIPVVANVSASFVRYPEEIRESLIKHVSRPVLWEDSMKLLLENNYKLFIEIGPGRVLTGFMKKIDKDVPAIHVENLETLERLFKLLKEEV